MTKQQIQKELFSRHYSFVDFINSLDEAGFNFVFENKWTAGQQLDHLCRATSPLVIGLKVIRFIPKLIFGRSNRPSKNYQDLVLKYKNVLAEGGKASGIFIPTKIKFNERERLTNKLLKTVSKIIFRLDNFSESDLDKFILPHPLLGKITIREMMYFTLYHVDHHKENIKRNLGDVQTGRRL